MRLVFLGPPGCGKGTQAKMLSKHLGLPHISTGDIFRDNIENNSPLGITAKGFINKGLLVPDNIVNSIVKERLEKQDCYKGFILDGYPRTIEQAEFLDSIVTIEKVISFELSDNELVRRISGRRVCKKCGGVYHTIWKKPIKANVCDNCGEKLIEREDEKPDTVKERLKVYHIQTAPLVKYYGEKGLIVNVDASLSIEAIYNALLKWF